MFGCRLRAPWTTSLAVFVLFATACSEKKAHDLGFAVSFACSADQEASDQLELRVLKDGCEGAEAVYEANLSKGTEAPPANGIEPGRYGFAARALSGGEVLATGCTEATLPASETPSILLRSASCVASSDAEIDTDAGNPDQPGPALDAAVGMDAAEAPETGQAISDPDAGEAEAAAPNDDAQADSGEAAAPVPCATDCKDSIPCTEDRCVNGECVHDPYTGPRECDGIACTQADRCESGTCKGGGANNAACPDDGNPCTVETCDPVGGCNRQNGDGRSCDDKISCTGSDKCTNGICRGADICSSGVCSAANGMCQVTCTDAACDDGDPCTTDSCSGGKCSHNRNVGAMVCTDNKSCTSNDACTSTGCAGTSTCPAGATCGGSTCKCNDTNETYCSASNTCANLTNSAQNCDQCGRVCANGGSCENSACKPTDASTCTAFRYNGHEYIVCTALTATWAGARDKCRTWGLGLAIIDDQAENDFLKGKSENADHWIGANDRGNNGSGQFNLSSERLCTLNAEEGHWYWERPSATNDGNADDNFRRFCDMASNTATTCTAYMGAYQNWRASEPNNDTCNCGIFGNCDEGEDCGVMYGADGTWNDSKCSGTNGFICESP